MIQRVQEQTTEHLPRDRGRDPVWCWETVEGVMNTTGESERIVREVLRWAWRAGYDSEAIQGKISPAVKDWRDVGGSLSRQIERWLGPAPFPEALSNLEGLK